MPTLFVALWTSGYLVGAIGTRAAPPFALLFWRLVVATVVMVVVAAELGGAVPLAGVGLVLLGLAGFVAGTLWQKRSGTAMDLRTGIAVQLIGAMATTAPLAVLTGGLGLPLTAAAVGSVLWLALVNSIGGFLLLFVLLRRSAGSSATSYLFLVPPVTALAAVPVLGEPLVLGALVGIVLAALGVVLVTRRPRPGRTPAGAPPPASRTDRRAATEDSGIGQRAEIGQAAEIGQDMGIGQDSTDRTSQARN